MTFHRSSVKDVSWVLQPLLVLPGVEHAVVLTSDGIVRGASPNLSTEAGEGAAAMMSALQGAARTLVVLLSANEEAELRQIVVESDSGYLFAAPAASNTVMAAFATRDVDLGVLAHLMQIQVKTLGDKVMPSDARDTGTPA